MIFFSLRCFLLILRCLILFSDLPVRFEYCLFHVMLVVIRRYRKFIKGERLSFLVTICVKLIINLWHTSIKCLLYIYRYVLPLSFVSFFLKGVLILYQNGNFLLR